MLLASKALPLLFFLDTLSLGLAAPLGNVLLVSSDLLVNGQDAQNLNAQFATLSESDPCTDGDSGCVGGKFAQCSGGTWQSTDCSAGTQCFALPLVNSRGTSITCDTEADALARIQATGATGGITGSTDSNSTSSDSGSVPSSPATIESSIPSATSSSTGTDGADDQPNGEDGGDEICSSEGDATATGAADPTATGSANDIGSSSIAEPESSVSSEESTPSATASAENSSDSTSTNLAKRQDAIDGIQSTLIPLFAVGSTPRPSSDSVAASEQVPSETAVVSDPLATGPATSEAIGTTTSATEGQVSGIAGGQTVTVTVTVTAPEATDNSASLVPANASLATATNVVQSDPLATGSQPLLSETGLASDTPITQSDPLAVPSQPITAAAGSASTPALPDTTSELAASGVPVSQVTGSSPVFDSAALPAQTTSAAAVSDPLLTSAATNNSVPPEAAANTAIPSAVTSAAADPSEIQSDVSRADVSSPVTSDFLTPASTTSLNASPPFDPASFSFMLTATI